MSVDWSGNCQYSFPACYSIRHLRCLSVGVLPVCLNVVFVSLPEALAPALLCSLPIGRSSHDHIPFSRSFGCNRLWNSKSKLPLRLSVTDSLKQLFADAFLAFIEYFFDGLGILFYLGKKKELITVNIHLFLNSVVYAFNFWWNEHLKIFCGNYDWRANLEQCLR